MCNNMLLFFDYNKHNNVTVKWHKGYYTNDGTCTLHKLTYIDYSIDHTCTLYMLVESHTLTTYTVYTVEHIGPAVRVSTVCTCTHCE